MPVTDWDDVIAGYQRTLGAVPEHVHAKQVTHPHDSEDERALFEIESARVTALEPSVLEPATVQLLQFVLCCSLQMQGGARIHAEAARHHGATDAQLLAAARVAWVISGGPALNTGIAAVAAGRAA